MNRRLAIDLPEGMKPEVEALTQALHSSSNNETVRRAIKAFAVIVSAEKQGKRIVLMDDQGQAERIMIIS